MAATATGKRNARLALNGRVESWPVIGSRRAAEVVSKESLARFVPTASVSPLGSRRRDNWIQAIAGD